MSIFDFNKSNHIGFGGNVRGILNPLRSKNRKSTKAKITRRYRRVRISAPPLKWGAWREVFAQIGVVGPDADTHVTEVNLSFSNESSAPSSFEYEIKGGDFNIRNYSGGHGASEKVTITGNVATSIQVRAKSHMGTQNIIVVVQ